MTKSGMVKTIVIFLILTYLSPFIGEAQVTDLGVSYGRFYAIYRHRDYGTGFRNMPASQYDPYPSFVVNKKYSEKVSAEMVASFMSFVQYTGTRLYSPGFYSVYNGGNISLTANYSLLKSSKFECRIKGGLAIGLVPDMYEGDFLEMFVFPVVDSISRGTIKRNFSPVFPALNTGIDFTYKLAKRFKISFAANYQKGFFKITEYDFYYNDGSGSNDQHAKQWGSGDFCGVQLGVRYLLRDENGKKFQAKKGKEL